MFEPLGKTRKLPYPLYNQETNGNITDDLGLTPNDFIWPEDPEERTIVPFYLSQREFTAIASSVDVGADIAYPEQYIEVWWLLVRSLKYRVPICEAIIDCITNDADVRQAIVNTVISSEEFNNYVSNEVRRLTTGQITGKLISGDCDNDVIAGRVLTLVERMDTYNTDFLELVEEATNDEERLADFLEAIPILGELPVGDVIQFSQDVLEDFAEGYSAASTEERRSAMAEGLYCIAKANPDCELTFEDVYIYMLSKMTTGLNIAATAFDIVTFVKDGDFDSPDLVFDAMYIMQIAFVLVGRDFGGLNLPSMSGMMRDALPSTIWEEWDECPDECVDGSNCGLPVVQIGRGIIICQDELYVDVELTPLDGNYICQIGFTSSGDCQFNGWITLSGTFTPWPQFDPFNNGVRFLGSNPTTDSGDPSTTGFNPSIILFFSTTPCVIRMRVS